ncbi:MAG TPA: hypothetical protein DEA08_16645 [Planctomycetes bacterium]|nr:hypothetical protein [Planctomycetota bacterium]
MALSWHVGDPVRVAPQRDVTELGTGVVIDVEALPDGTAKALLVRFDDGPRAGVWYSVGTMRPVVLPPPPPRPALVSPAPLGVPQGDRFDRPGLLVGRDVLEFGACRDPQLAEGLAAWANRAGPRGNSWERQQWLTAWLGLSSGERSIMSGKLPWTTRCADRLRIKRGALLALLSRRAEEHDFANLKEAVDWAEGELEAWESGVQRELRAAGLGSERGGDQGGKPT